MENVHNGNAIIKGQILYLRSRHIAKPAHYIHHSWWWGCASCCVSVRTVNECWTRSERKSKQNMKEYKSRRESFSSFFTFGETKHRPESVMLENGAELDETKTNTTEPRKREGQTTTVATNETICLTFECNFFYDNFPVLIHFLASIGFNFPQLPSMRWRYVCRIWSSMFCQLRREFMIRIARQRFN